jgi:hypothetical protein
MRTILPAHRRFRSLEEFRRERARHRRAAVAMLPGLAPLVLGGVEPGYQIWGGYSTPAGTYTFVVPEFNTLQIALWGAGGGGGAQYLAGSAGAATTIAALSLSAGGGGGGSISAAGGGYAAAAGGTATGGNTNTSGNAGGAPGTSNGGGAAIVGTGGLSAGGGGVGSDTGSSTTNGGGGGSGGYLLRSYTPASLSAGTSLTVVVGAGGTRATGAQSDGTDGLAYILWS